MNWGRNLPWREQNVSTKPTGEEATGNDHENYHELSDKLWQDKTEIKVYGPTPYSEPIFVNFPRALYDKWMVNIKKFEIS